MTDLSQFEIPKGCPLPKVQMAPYMLWLLERLGWGEQDPERAKIIAQYWTLTGLNYKDIFGAVHAWCAMIATAALEENGFRSTRNAGAHSVYGMQPKCDLQPNANVCVKHSSGPLAGHFHDTFCFAVEDNGEYWWGLGGNQNNKISIERFPTSDAAWCWMPTVYETDKTIGE